MDSEIIRWKEGFSIWADAQRIDIIIMTISKLRLFNSLIVRALNLRGREDNLVTLDLTFACLSVSRFPQVP